MNMAHISDEELSDDEVFFGKLTLKNIKKLLFFNNTGQTNTFDTNSKRQDNNMSIKIIEAHSQPNLHSLTANVNSPKFSSVPGSPALYNRASDDSFIQMESMVSKLCTSPGQANNLELNNTFEVIDYILKKGPNLNTNKTDSEKAIEVKHHSHLPCVSPKTDFTPTQAVFKEVYQISAPKSAKKFTPAKSSEKRQAGRFVTPASSVNLKAKTPLIKTPVNLLHNKPSASAKKTPSKTNSYQHIASPIAAYIKNSPQAPLVKDVYPRKPLPVPSSIPKPIKNPCKVHNKENVNLPSVAYKSAKKTKVITLPDKEKLPQSQWAKKIMSTCPQATVMKHENREIDFTKKPLINQKPVEDSFADLSVMQAELSVCTQKSAFKTKKHY